MMPVAIRIFLIPQFNSSSGLSNLELLAIFNSRLSIVTQALARRFLRSEDDVRYYPSRKEASSMPRA